MKKNSVPSIKISVVVPVLNEGDNIAYMVHEISRSLIGWDFEMIFVDDFSSDDTVARLGNLQNKFVQLRCLCHSRQCGQSAAVKTGVLNATGSIIATLDGDGQNPPHEIPNLVWDLVRSHQNVGLIQGQRQCRKDTNWKKWASKIANGVRQGVLKDNIQDSGCGLKAFRRDAYLSLPYFDHIHRFMPAMMLREGYMVRVLPVSHEERKAGVSKYGNLSRAIVGILDLLGVVWLIQRSNHSETKEILLNHENEIVDIKLNKDDHINTSGLSF